MKKSIIAVFSVSLTAGAIYLGYDQLKKIQINNLVKAWEKEAGKKNIAIQKEELKKQFDELFLWDLRLVAKFTEKQISSQHEQAMELLLKIKKRGLMEKINLKIFTEALRKETI